MRTPSSTTSPKPPNPKPPREYPSKTCNSCYRLQQLLPPRPRPPPPPPLLWLLLQLLDHPAGGDVEVMVGPKPYSTPEADRVWGIWGSYYDIRKGIFYLLQGDYKPWTLNHLLKGDYKPWTLKHSPLMSISNLDIQYRWSIQGQPSGLHWVLLPSGQKCYLLDRQGKH